MREWDRERECCRCRRSCSTLWPSPRHVPSYPPNNYLLPVARYGAFVPRLRMLLCWSYLNRLCCIMSTNECESGREECEKNIKSLLHFFTSMPSSLFLFFLFVFLFSSIKCVTRFILMFKGYMFFNWNLLYIDFHERESNV